MDVVGIKHGEDRNDGTLNTNGAAVDESDNYDDNSRPDAAILQSNHLGQESLGLCKNPSGFSSSSHALQTSNAPEVTANVEAQDTPQSIPFKYYDPFNPNERLIVCGEGVNANCGVVAGHFYEKKGAAKEVCGKISKLLRDKHSPSKGSRMFQKRRKRAEKFTLVGYGTQPTEDEYRQSESEDSTSEELARIDYGSEISTDDEISVYDKPGISNVVTYGEHLNPSEQIIQTQLKSLAMDASGMRGKGAKIFARRQQRMENYTITDENRRHSKNESDSETNSSQQKASTRSMYFRPGSSIGIAPKTTYTSATPPVVSSNQNLSGYGTDVENEYRRPFRAQVNYFSDCEGPSSTSRNKPRRTRPANRKAWDDDEDLINQSHDEFRLDYHKPPASGFTNVSSHIDPQMGRQSFPPQVPAQEEPPMQQFRKVLPPGRSPIQRLPPSPSLYEPASLLSHDNQLLGQRPPLPDAAAAPRRTWARVSFQPRKKPAGQVAPTTVIDYPCARSYTASQNKQLKSQTGYRASSLSPKRPTVSQQKPLRNTSLLPDNKKQQQEGVANTAIPAAECRTPAKPTAAVSLLEKPMERKSAPDAARPVQYKAVDHVESSKGPTDADFIDSPNQPTDGFSAISQHDFVAGGEKLSENSTSTEVDRTASITKNDKNDEFKVQHSTKDGESNLKVKQGNSGSSKLQESPTGSPASVLSYVSSNSPTYTSMLPSRCLTPPSRPYTPNGSQSNHRSIKIASKNATANTLSSNDTTPSREVAQQKGPLSNLRDVLPSPIAPKAQQQEYADGDSKKQTKVSACLKVLDPSQPIFKPKAPVQFQPSPTLNAILQSENESSYGSLNTPAMTYTLPENNTSDIKPPKHVPKPVSQTRYLARGKLGSAGQGAQPLGMLAGDLKGKGAKMFEKQQKRMQHYTRETSSEDFPELNSPKNGSIQSPIMRGTFSYGQPNGRMAGFSPDGKKIEPGKDVKSSMMQVMGEFQKGSKPGKVKRPSENRKKGRDPLYYQQQLFCSPPSADDFVEPPPEASEPSSDASSMTSSVTNTSSLSSFNHTDYRNPPTLENMPAARVSDNDFVVSPNTSTTSLTQESDVQGDIHPTNSTSSMSSQRSTGPKTAPKPSKSLITRQLSKPSSPIPVVSVSPTPEINVFRPTPTSPTPNATDEVFTPVETNMPEKEAKCIETLILQERLSEDNRYDIGGNSETDVRRRAHSREGNADTESVEHEPGSASNLVNGGYNHLTQNNVPAGFKPPSYQEVMSSESRPRLFAVSNASNARDGAVETSRSHGKNNLYQAKPSRFTVPKPKFNARQNGAEVKMWKPGK